MIKQDLAKRIMSCTDEELIDIYLKIKLKIWDDRLGDAPENFWDLPAYLEWYHRLMRIKSKDYYLRPIIRAIASIVSEKEIYKEQLRRRHEREKNFEQLWRERSILKLDMIEKEKLFR